MLFVAVCIVFKVDAFVRNYNGHITNGHVNIYELLSYDMYTVFYTNTNFLVALLSSKKKLNPGYTLVRVGFFFIYVLHWYVYSHAFFVRS